MVRRISARDIPSTETSSGSSVKAPQVNLGMSVTEDMHMSGLMVVREDDDSKLMRTKYGNH